MHFFEAVFTYNPYFHSVILELFQQIRMVRELLVCTVGTAG